MAKFVKVILFLLLTVAFHSIAGNVSTEKMVDKQGCDITYAMGQRGEICAPDLPGKPVAELTNLQPSNICDTYSTCTAWRIFLFFKECATRLC